MYSSATRALATLEPATLENDPLDLVHLERQTLGDRDLQRELLALFVTQSPSLVARMRALGDGEPAAFADLAHHLKGSALAIGAVGVAALATGLEEAARREAEGLEAPETRKPATRDLAGLEAALAAAIVAIDALLI